MKRLTLALATVALFSMPSQALAGPITLVASPGSGTLLPFTGQLTAATLTLDMGTGAPLPFGAFTLEINGIDIGYAVRTSNSPQWSFGLTQAMLAAANQAGAVDVRFDFGGSYNALTSNSLQLDGNLNQTAIPEPGTLVLFGIGLVGIATVVRRRRAA